MKLAHGILIGFVLGGIVATALLSHAECCAQFDVPFSIQLEQERQETWQRAQQPLYIEPWLPYGMARKQPC